MFKRNQLYTALVSVSLLAAVSTNTLAQAPVVSEATVTVQNTFAFAETTAISFGTIRATATASGATVATYVVSGDGTTTVPASGGAPAAISELTAGTPGEYAISGAAPFADITITLPAAPINMTLTGAPPGTPKFTVGTFTAYILDGPNALSAYADPGNLATTDVNGAVNFAVGATLSTDSAASTEPYADGIYRGNYTISVSY